MKGRSNPPFAFFYTQPASSEDAQETASSCRKCASIRRFFACMGCRKVEHTGNAISSADLLQGFVIRTDTTTGKKIRVKEWLHGKDKGKMKHTWGGHSRHAGRRIHLPI